MSCHLFRRAGVVVAVTLSLGAGLSITACTQMPTEKQGVSDMRPQISFQIERSDLASAEVLVDGLSMGVAGSYLAGQAALRVRPGTHELQVVAGGRVILSERIYLADGVNKSFLLK
jgi:hypothetical protein